MKFKEMQIGDWFTTRFGKMFIKTGEMRAVSLASGRMWETMSPVLEVTVETNVKLRVLFNRTSRQPLPIPAEKLPRILRSLQRQ